MSTATLNPLDSTLAQDADAQSLWSKCSKSFSTIAGTFDQLTEVSNTLWAQIAKIEADSRITQAAKASDTAQVRNLALQAVETHRRSAEAARDQVKGVITPILDPSGFVNARDILGNPDPQRTLVSIERTRDAFSRVKMILDSLNPGQVLPRASTLASEAAERGDSYTMGALRQNLEAYLESRGVKMPHADVVDALNQSMAAASSPQFRAASQIQATLDEAFTNLQGVFLVALGYCKGSSTMRIQGLPGFPGQPPVSL